MKCLTCKLAGIAFLFAGMLAVSSCTSEKKTESSDSVGEKTTTLAVQPGEAGGMIEDKFTVSATVSAIDKSTRRITLKSEDRDKITLTASPEVRNFDQIRSGDKVSATITERLLVFVRHDGAEPSVSHAAALARAPKGAKPGALVAESYEIVASVKSIDSAKRTAALLFSDGQTRTVKVRPDVDLSRYRVGDSVVIRITAVLSVLVEKT